MFIGSHPGTVAGERLGIGRRTGRLSINLDAIRINSHFAAALSSTLQCAASASSGYGSAIVADAPADYYPLDEPQGARVALDASGNCRNATRGTNSTVSAGRWQTGRDRLWFLVSHLRH